ncbi:MAG TPA: hypothetical protein VNN80_05900 [Polyangiaceae bacterium]|nr:hypothetical protein [Polyangiaceae bacterium]
MSKTTSKSLQLARAGGLTLACVLAVALPGRAQVACVGEFDVCFPNLDAGAPSDACGAADPADAAAVGACLENICGSEANEPQAGFFGYCCAQGGSVRYDDFCVLVVQTACPAVAEQCADRCPPLELLTGTVPLAPPPSACIAGYPAFIAEVCASDPFCCTTSWDEICAAGALAASLSP